MSLPLAFFFTWTPYGTWLPGDARGWVDKHDSGFHEPDPRRVAAARKAMTETAVSLTPEARAAVDAAIRRTCGYRGWTIHAMDVRAKHVHVVVSAGDIEPGRALGALKAYATRELNALYPSPRRQHWWTEDGSKRRLYTVEALNAGIQYVLTQDVSWMKHIK